MLLAYFNENCFSQPLLPNQQKVKGLRSTYLHELSKINQYISFPFNKENRLASEQGEQLSFFVSGEQIKDQLDQLRNTYNEFHILTYKIDDAYQISEVIHYLPNPENNIAYKVDDLSTYISGAELTDEEREVIAPEQENGIIDPAAYDIGILEDEEKN